MNNFCCAQEIWETEQLLHTTMQSCKRIFFAEPSWYRCFSFGAKMRRFFPFFEQLQSLTKFIFLRAIIWGTENVLSIRIHSCGSRFSLSQVGTGPALTCIQMFFFLPSSVFFLFIFFYFFLFFLFFLFFYFIFFIFFFIFFLFLLFIYFFFISQQLRELTWF